MHGWWMLDLYHTDPVLLFSWVFWVVVSICLHELGHGYVAMLCGDDTPRISGHMTLNPFVHIPPRAWIMFVLVGMTFGLMPVNPSRYRRSSDDALVAMAGPGMNLVQAIVVVLFWALWEASASKLVSPTLYHNMTVFLRVGVALNIASVAFNLIPVPPLDGSRVLAVFSRSYSNLISSQEAQIVGMIILCVMLFTVGAVLFPMSFAAADAVHQKFVTVLRAIAP